MKKLIGLIVFSLLFSVGINSYSQTPDGETPAVEDVCDGLEGASYGLCNAYCEAMDCDDPETKASDKACEKVLGNYQKQTDFPGPPCDCCELNDTQEAWYIVGAACSPKRHNPGR